MAPGRRRPARAEHLRRRAARELGDAPVPRPGQRLLVEPVAAVREEAAELRADGPVGHAAVERVPRPPLRVELAVAAVGVLLEGRGRGGLALGGGGAVEARPAVDGHGLEVERVLGEPDRGRVEVDEAPLLEVEGDDVDGLRVVAGDLAEAADGEEQVLVTVARVLLRRRARRDAAEAPPPEVLGEEPVGLGLGPRARVAPGQEKGAKFPTSKAPISVVFRSFRLIFGRAIISRNGLEAWMLFPKRARAEHSLKRH